MGRHGRKMTSGQSGIPSRKTIEKVMHSVVQIVALRRGSLGNYSTAWTGSGTIVDPSGFVLTNCHVANPRAMGMPSPEADRLAVAITQRSDEPPALTYFAKIVAQSPELDLAVLRIVSGLDGRPVSDLDLSAVDLGDSETLELGDTLSIFGYPGIGGDTVTFTQGAVAGFSRQEGVADRRAWVKTDATIAGGNSGGTAVNHRGQLVGIPTQAAAGTGVTPVDARPVVDTTGDGRVDHRDTPMAIGGFINGLRPANLAASLLSDAGVGGKADSTARPTGQATAPREATKPAAKPKARPEPAKDRDPGPRFSTLAFSGGVTRDGRPINPTAILASGSKEMFVTFEYQGMRNGVQWGLIWAHNGNKIASDAGKWEDGARGRKVITLANRGGLPSGEYRLALTVGKQIMAEGRASVGQRVDDTDTEVSGHIVDQQTGRGIRDVLVIALRPGVRVEDFVAKQSQDMAFTMARSGSKGQFTFPQQLPKGQAYGLVVVARGYRDLAIESALRIGAQAPEKAEMNPIALVRG